jgi:DNA topoisomerase-2
MAENYKKYTQIEHVLARPGMYVGDTKCTTSKCWVLNENENENRAEFKLCKWNPGIFKIFDEILVNAADEAQRNKSMKCIKVKIENDEISIYNDSGIPIEIHPEYKVYIPELIFANLLTSSNYDDSQKRTTGGLNGLGAKLTAIFSEYFIIETAKDGKKYTQKIEKNLSKINKPKITTSKSEYTKITFKPDFEKFETTGINDNTFDVLLKRVYDICAITSKDISVYFNDKKLTIKDFTEYISAYIGPKKSCPRVIQETPRWKVGIAPSDSGFQCVSFVNGISTSDGGSHVDHVVNPIIKKVTEIIQEKHKNITIKQQYIKDNLFVFIDCLIENASYSSQTKEKNITKISDFGSRFTPSDDFITNVSKMGIMENILIIANAKEKKSLQKTDGKKTNRVIIPKLDDANKAGTKDSKLCTIIFTEGDSAKATAISGLSVIGRDNYGVFPLRGKLLNTRTATYSQLSKNEEINNIKQILGLQSGKKYSSVSELRYGKILVMTDADTDGFHIKSLIVNFIGNGWPELLKVDFIYSLVTPIIKLTKKSQIIPFYNVDDYKKYKESHDISGFKVKYYKGLGTSTSTEAKEYFKEMKTLNYKTDTNEDEYYLKLAFTKTEADARKRWILSNIKSPETLDYNIKNVNIKDLINKELVLFSIADNVRSIPSLVDGLKPSQRKIIFACIKKKLYSEIKVSQLAGYVSEVSSYHHGEASLQDTIINLSQTFTGSNNMNLLEPVGQFGTRLLGGKDSSSPRYIFTHLSKNFKELFNEDDLDLLDYLDDDGQLIEPKFYVPTLPLLLINGACGIGTGFSTDVPCFNPDDIKDRLLRLVENEDSDIAELTPWYNGFTGKIKKLEENKWTSHGVYTIKANVITVTELPVGTWTEDYKSFLDKLETEGVIYSYKNMSTETNVHFEIKIPLEIVYEWKDNHEIEKRLKLIGHISAKNMYVFNENNEIVKMESPEEIIYHFWRIRNEYYIKRQKKLIKKLSHELGIITAKINFVNDVIDEKIKVFRQKLEHINKQLEEKQYLKIENSYTFLTDMKIHTFSEDTIEKLLKKQKDLDMSLKKISSYKLRDFWLESVQ